VGTADYRALAEFRHQIRRFLAFSAAAARREGIEPQQHQALLAITGLPPDTAPTIGAVAQRLQLRHHTTVELVDRLAARGLVTRTRSTADRRRVELRLTRRGEGLLRRLSLHHLAELRTLAPALARTLGTLTDGSAGGRRGRHA
jgi:DNA-binding MarR family transcriptional regulator